MYFLRQCVLLLLNLIISIKNTKSILLVPNNHHGIATVADLSHCVTPVNGTNLPICEILFREVTGKSVNATCLENNVFLVKPYRRSDDPGYPIDNPTELLPPYLDISCSAAYPTDFTYDGLGALESFRVWRGMWPEFQNTSQMNGSMIYEMNLEVVLAPESTGRYVFHSIADPRINTSFFIYTESASRPYMIGSLRSNRYIPRAAIKLNSTSVLLPCVSSSPKANVSLVFQGEIMQGPFSSFDRQRGFIVHYPAPGDYKCISLSGSNENQSNGTDFTIVHVKSTQEAAEHNASSPNPLTLIIRNITSAVCSSNDTYSHITFKNFQATNPTETRLFEQCLKYRSPYCSSHTFHQWRDGHKIDNWRCPNNSLNCLWVIDVQREGMFYCADDKGNFQTQEYFTGLDDKIYSNLSGVLTQFLIKPEWKPYASANTFKTDTVYEIYCDAARYIFSKDRYLLGIKYKNGSVHEDWKLWEEGGSGTYLDKDTSEIICSAKLWKTNEMISTATKIVVTEKQCDYNQFKCRNGRCIQKGWRCDGESDCLDGSDEENCAEHHCREENFRCANGYCIPPTKKCNNRNECLDGSDESFETCANITCDPESFKCMSGQCTPAHFLCDGDKDCLDNSDESLEHCSKYYPTIAADTNVTNVTFVMNFEHELICRVNRLPMKLMPAIVWWRRGREITDPNRLWRDLTGQALALRFSNVTEDDSGQFVCIATNKLQKSIHNFTVEVVRLDQATVPGNGKDFVEPSTSTSTTSRSTRPPRPQPTSATTVTPRIYHLTTGSTVSSRSYTVHVPDKTSWLTISLLSIAVVIVVLVVGAIGWRYFTRRHVPEGSARMREDQEVVFSGI